MDDQGIPSEELRRLFSERGCVVLQGFFDPYEIQRVSEDMERLVRTQLRQCASPAYSQRHRESYIRRKAGDIDYLAEGTLALAQRERGRLAAVYDAAMKLVSTRRIGTDSRLVRMVQELMDTPLVAIGNNIIVRIDLPGEERFLFDHWHQDYPYAMGSRRGVVVWTPLRSVSMDAGPVEVLLGSHRRGLLPTEVRADGHFRAADPKLLESCLPIRQPVEVGDVVLFDIMTVHRSSPNRSAAPRWTLTYRYCDMEHEASAREGWPCFYRQGRHFTEIHPGAVASDRRNESTSERDAEKREQV